MRKKTHDCVRVLHVKQLIYAAATYSIAYVLVENSWQPTFYCHSAAEFCLSNNSLKKYFFIRKLLILGLIKKLFRTKFKQSRKFSIKN